MVMAVHQIKRSLVLIVAGLVMGHLELKTVKQNVLPGEGNATNAISKITTQGYANTNQMRTLNRMAMLKP